jgi:hypothetical protein
VAAVFLGEPVLVSLPPRRHCEERSDEAIQSASAERFWIASLRSQ